jgi:hypothetical protein
MLVVTADPHGVARITSLGHLRLPASVRHTCGIGAGDRLLLAVLSGPDALIAYPIVAVDAMILRFHQSHRSAQ